jgi:FAD/FMN-containing dehydrogenase
MPTAPSPSNSPVILWRGTGLYPDAAYSARGRFYMAGYAQWEKAEDDLANEAWLETLFDEMEPFASGHYINEFDRETRASKTQSCFAPANWKRVQDLRQRHDPDGVFHGFLGTQA